MVSAVTVQRVAKALPQNLVDQIIEEVVASLGPREYKSTLGSCALVSRAWLPLSTHYLLSHVEVNTLDIPRFIAVAKSSSRFAENTRNLVINGACDLAPVLADIFQCLPLLHCIELWSNYLPKDAFSASLTSPKHRIAHLKLSGADLEGIPYILRAFEEVDILEMRSVEITSREEDHHSDDDEEDDEEDEHDHGHGHGHAPGDGHGHDHDHGADPVVAPYDGPPLPVGRLVLNDCCTTPIMDFLSSCLLPAALFVNAFDRMDLLNVGRLLARAGAALEHINLMPVQDDDMAQATALARFRFAELAVLGQCAHLQSVSVDLIDVPWGTELARGVLAYIPDGTRRLRFTLEADQVADVLDALAELARARPHGQLQRVEFRRVCLGFVPDEPEYAEILQEVREQAQAKLPARYNEIVTFMP